MDASEGIQGSKAQSLDLGYLGSNTDSSNYKLYDWSNDLISLCL